jgi:hypothetical protein
MKLIDTFFGDFKNEGLEIKIVPIMDIKQIFHPMIISGLESAENLNTKIKNGDPATVNNISMIFNTIQSI